MGALPAHCLFAPSRRTVPLLLRGAACAGAPTHRGGRADPAARAAGGYLVGPPFGGAHLVASKSLANTPVLLRKFGKDSRMGVTPETLRFNSDVSGGRVGLSPKP